MPYSKSYNKKTGVTYVYEVLENKWDKEKGYPVSKRRVIGKIDPETGEIVPTRKRGSKDKNYNIPSELKDDNADPAAVPSVTMLKDALNSELRWLKESAASIQKRIDEIEKQIKSLD